MIVPLVSRCVDLNNQIPALHLSEVISDPDVKRKHCRLSVQEPLRVGEDLEEGVGYRGSWLTLSMLGSPSSGGCQSWGRAGWKSLPGKVASENTVAPLNLNFR